MKKLTVLLLFLLGYFFASSQCTGVAFTTGLSATQVSGSNIIKITWTTTNEYSTLSKFVVQRSYTGNNEQFSEIGEATPAGSSSAAHTYTFYDNYPCYGSPALTSPKRLYYRISSVSIDGIYCYNVSMWPVLIANFTYCPTLYNQNDCSITQIIGPDAVCGSGTYLSKYYGVTTNSANPVTWTIYPANAAVVSTNGLSLVTVTRNGSNSGIVTLSTKNACGATVSKTIQVGPPATPGISVTGVEPLGRGTQVDVQVSTTAPGPYLWFVNGTQVATAFSANATINGGNNCNVTNTVSVNVANTCGSASASTTFVRPCGNGNSFLVYPSPGTGIITLSAITSEQQKINAAASVASVSEKVYQIKVTDQFGNLKKTISYPGGVTNTKIDLSNLQNGTYFIQIYNNSTWSSQQIIIAR